MPFHTRLPLSAPPTTTTFAEASAMPLRQVSNNSNSKQKRRRLTPEQHGMLEVYFLKSPMPDTKARESLAEQAGLDPKAVQIWFQNRRQKEKRLPSPERTHKNLPTVKFTESKKEPVGKENIAPLSDTDEEENASFLSVTSCALHRTVSAPAAGSGSILLPPSLPIRASTRPSVHRASSLNIVTNCRSTDSDEVEHELTKHMPFEESSPVKATFDSVRPLPSLRRSQSFTLEWATAQSSNIRPDRDLPKEGKKMLELSPTSERRQMMPRKRTKMPTLAIDVSGAPAFKMDVDSGLPSPFATSLAECSLNTPRDGFFGDRSPLEIADLGMTKFGGLLEAAETHLNGPTPVVFGSPLQSEASTDDEVTIAAKKRGGDQSFSSLECSDGEEFSGQANAVSKHAFLTDDNDSGERESECAHWLLAMAQ